jgi:hypothetical protein
MKTYSFLGFFVFALLASTNVANAASLYIDPAMGSLSRGDSITLSVRLDINEETEECVNAVDAVIRYTDNLTPVDVTMAESIFSMWVEPPKIDKENKLITFAGGIPNGYCGRIQGDPRLTNTIAKLIFRLPGFSVGSGGISASSTGAVEFSQETTAYLNDGAGTKAELSTYGATVSLSDKPGPELKDDWQKEIEADNIPPEQFSIEMTEIDGKHAIVFNTTDKQTGIDEYQVMEEPLSKLFDFVWGRADAPWVVSRSPHTLDDQSLNSTIRVKAIDKAGNEYTATLIPDEEVRGVATRDILMMVGLGVIVFFFIGLSIIGVRVYKRRQRRSVSN